MLTNLLIGLIGVGVTIALLYAWYVSIVSRRNKTLEALSGIDVQLKKRSSLIPNILTIAKKFLEHERNLMEEVTELRTKADRDYDKEDVDAVREHLGAVEMLSSRMGQLMVQVEAYPDLKSDQTMAQAMRTYNEVEAQIAAARRFYNTATASLNNSVQIFPGNIIANMVGISQMPFYEIDEGANGPVKAAEHLG